MNAREIGLDYFQIYNLEYPVDLPRRLPSAARTCWLKDQFDQEPVQSRVDLLNRFADRVSKNGEPLFDKNAHLTCYRLIRPPRESLIRRSVWVANQFLEGREQELQIREPLGLMVPARKRMPRGEWSRETKLDHYKIYRVTRGRPINATVTLEDQFGRRKTWVHYPVAFAAPVWKKREREFPILNDHAHLTIYTVDASEDVPVTIYILDQFFPSRPLRLRLDVSYLLAVPSKKLGWETAGTNT